MWDFKISTSIAMMIRTMPFLMLRGVVYLITTLLFIAVTGTGAGIGYGLGGIFSDPDGQAMGGFYGGLAGGGLSLGAYLLARSYILYMVKAGHIAVMMDMIDGKPLPPGQSQITYARKSVTERFAQANILFAVDRLIAGVLGALSGLVRGLLAAFPIPGSGALAMVAHMFLRMSVGFVDEIILAYTLRTRHENAWQAAREGLVLYAQNPRVMMRNAAWLTVIVYGISLLIFLVMLVPAGAVAVLYPGGWSAAGIAIALLLTWGIKAAFIEPFAIACMMQVYFKTIDGQDPNPEWEDRLDGLSAKFRKLTQKAEEAPAPADAAATV